MLYILGVIFFTIPKAIFSNKEEDQAVDEEEFEILAPNVKDAVEVLYPVFQKQTSKSEEVFNKRLIQINKIKNSGGRKIYKTRLPAYI